MQRERDRERNLGPSNGRLRVGASTEIPSISERHASHLTFVVVKPDVFMKKQKSQNKTPLKALGLAFLVEDEVNLA